MGDQNIHQSSADPKNSAENESPGESDDIQELQAEAVAQQNTAEPRRTEDGEFSGGDDRSDPDSQSDPARSDKTGHDWTTEGGATPRGPATDTDDVPTESADESSTTP